MLMGMIVDADHFDFYFLARKSDQWFAVDPATGTKLHSFTPDGVLGTCPILTNPAGTLYIGRSGKCASTTALYGTMKPQWLPLEPNFMAFILIKVASLLRS